MYILYLTVRHRYDNSPPSQEKKTSFIPKSEIQATSAVHQGQGKPHPTNCSFQEVCGRTVLNLNPRTWRRPKNTLSDKQRPNHASVVGQCDVKDSTILRFCELVVHL